MEKPLTIELTPAGGVLYPNNKEVQNMLPEKLPTPSTEAHWNDPQNEAEWEEYFADRRKLDKELSEQEQFAIAYKMLETNPFDPEYRRLASMLPMTPAQALATKTISGLKSLIGYNLYEAKLEYPDEF